MSDFGGGVLFHSGGYNRRNSKIQVHQIVIYIKDTIYKTIKYIQNMASFVNLNEILSYSVHNIKTHPHNIKKQHTALADINKCFFVKRSKRVDDMEGILLSCWTHSLLQTLRKSEMNWVTPCERHPPVRHGFTIKINTTLHVVFQSFLHYCISL